LQRYQTVSEFLRLSWIRPEDLKFYQNIGICYFKLQGRQHVIKGEPLRTVEAYFKESYEGCLMELLDMFNPTCSFRFFVDNKKLDGYIRPFYENEAFCKNDCDSCNYCEAFARKTIDYKEGERVIDMARNYFTQCDSYEKIVAALGESNGSVKSDNNIEADFELD
jgi:collagenase-like PrtC family protease